MRYISLFSGIGGFEKAIELVYPNAECIGYSEIKPSAQKVYRWHYPEHNNLGDITLINRKQILELGRCDLLVAGFPCTNLSSMANFNSGNNGLDGPQSGLFWEMIRIIKIAKPKYVIIENNASMTLENQHIITESLRKIFKNILMTHLNASDFSLQTRRRLFWTNFPINTLDSEGISKKFSKKVPNWDDILEPIGDIPTRYFISDLYINNTMNKIIDNRSGTGSIILAKHACKKNKNGKQLWKFITKMGVPKQISRFQMGQHSDNGLDNIPYTYPIGKSRPLCSTKGIIVHRTRDSPEKFYIRNFTITERCRLFGFPDDYVDMLVSEISKIDVLGNSVVVPVITHILRNLR